MKTIDQLYSEMTAAFAAETGTTPSDTGDLAVRFYAVAAQLYALYVQADWVKRQCFPQTAEGVSLDRHAALRGITRRPATAAQGTVRFTGAAAQGQEVAIPAGTVCMTVGGVRFVTTRDGRLEAGALQVDVPAQAVAAGPEGNVAANSVRAMAVPPVGVSACTNPAPFFGGQEAEGDEALRERVMRTFQRLPNGANAAFYEQGALGFPQVAGAKAVARSRGIGTVDVVISVDSGLPSAPLLAQVADYLQSVREVAVDVQVTAPETVTVPVAVTVTPAPGADGAAVAAQVETALRSYFNGGLLGQDIVRAKLGALIFALPGVANYAMTQPASDVSVADTALPVLGTLTVGVSP